MAGKIVEQPDLKTSFESFLRQMITISDEDVNALWERMTPRKLLKKELLVASGHICNRIVFFNRGYFRFYHVSYQGDEITSDFYFAPGFVTSYTSLITGQPSLVNVQAMDDMDVMELKRSDVYKLYDQNPAIERLGRRMAEVVAMTSETHLFMLLNQSAENRYRNLLHRYPGFVQQIPLQYIASYLGITQETLSRIRKSL
jgi:CRP-like cAMP-binding protein